MRKGAAGMAYVKDVSHDEVRSGFLVTTDRKNSGKDCWKFGMFLMEYAKSIKFHILLIPVHC